MTPQVLLICGPTATGKTRIALSLADQLGGEIVSADSRHVYIGMDIITGKDLPPGFIKKPSSLIWHGRPLFYFENGSTRIWLVDLVEPDSDFNLSFWHECAELVIRDILDRGKLPIVVGGTGLYFKSLLQDLSGINVPPNPKIRQELQPLSVPDQYEFLRRLDPVKAASLNLSDRSNPRRLIRAIEIASAPRSSIHPVSNSYSFLQIGLTADLPVLQAAVASRLTDRVKAGAKAEVQRLTSKYSFDLPSMTACGYTAFKEPDWESAWLAQEKHLLKKQLTWFKKQPGITWFDIGQPDWQALVGQKVHSWYNKTI